MKIKNMVTIEITAFQLTACEGLSIVHAFWGALGWLVHGVCMECAGETKTPLEPCRLQY